MQQEFEGEVAFVGVSSRDELPAMQDFVATYGVEGFPHVADVRGDVWSAYSVVSQPAFAFIDDDGSVEVVAGATGEDGLRERVAELVAT